MLLALFSFWPAGSVAHTFFDQTSPILLRNPGAELASMPGATHFAGKIVVFGIMWQTRPFWVLKIHFRG